MNFENESWKPVVNFEGYYEVSDMGRVRSLGRRIRSAITHSKKQYRRPRILRGGTVGGRYRNISFCVEGVETTWLVHKIVMEAFVGPTPDGLEINHKNGNKQDNRLDNLEFVTHKTNMIHARETGLLVTPRGEASGGAILNNAQVSVIQTLLATSTLSYTQIAKAFGVSRTTISQINAGRTWRHLLGDYTLPIRKKPSQQR